MKFNETFEGVRHEQNYSVTFGNNEAGELCLVVFDFGIMHSSMRNKELFDSAESHWFTADEFSTGNSLLPANPTIQQIIDRAIDWVDEGSIGSDHLSPVSMTRDDFIKAVKEGIL